MKKLTSLFMAVIMMLAFIPIFGGQLDAVSAASDGGGGGTINTAPVAATNLALPSGYVVGDTSVKMTWKDNSTNEDGFRIDRVIKGGASWIQAGTVGPNVVSFTDTGLTPGTTYYYRVKAYNWVGTSKSSNDLIITTANSSAPPVVTPPTYSDTPSSWAVAEIELAKTAGLTIDTLLSAYNKPITRAEFASLVVKLYEKATGTVVVPVSPNPFTDTADQAVLKAYTAGIINGVSADKFAPNANVTRQEMAVMLQRELKAADPEGTYVASAAFTTIFADQSKIATWALEAVRFMNESGIVNGVGANRIDPIGNATREQAMLMDYRNYVKFVMPEAE